MIRCFLQLKRAQCYFSVVAYILGEIMYVYCSAVLGSTLPSYSVELYKGLAQLNLFYKPAHPKLNPCHHQVYFNSTDTHPPTLHYILHLPCTASSTIVPISSPSTSPIPPPSLQSPTFLSSWFSTPMSVLLVLPHRNTGGVLYIHVRGKHWQRGTIGHSRYPYFRISKEQVGGSSAQQDGLFPVPL